MAYELTFYEYETGKLRITGLSGSVDDPNTEIDIPSTINDKTVTIIGAGAFKQEGKVPFGSENITSITLPNTIETIGGDAFNGLTNAVVRINGSYPEQLTLIGVDAFLGVNGMHDSFSNQSWNINSHGEQAWVSHLFEANVEGGGDPADADVPEGEASAAGDQITTYAQLHAAVNNDNLQMLTVTFDDGNTLNVTSGYDAQNNLTNENPTIFSSMAIRSEHTIDPDERQITINADSNNGLIDAITLSAFKIGELVANPGVCTWLAFYGDDRIVSYDLQEQDDGTFNYSNSDGDVTLSATFGNLDGEENAPEDAEGEASASGDPYITSMLM